ncbi:hypothetical protein I3760_09G076800 [Carya illinoinensis]|nr:hypothetical protein I3760_09G076800 [Carya illinoinensis]
MLVPLLRRWKYRDALLIPKEITRINDGFYTNYTCLCIACIVVVVLPQVKIPIVQVGCSWRLGNIRFHVRIKTSHPPDVLLCFIVGIPSD